VADPEDRIVGREGWYTDWGMIKKKKGIGHNLPAVPESGPCPE
jgi:hypothetical protein